MKLVLSNNQSAKFIDFFTNLSEQSGAMFEYSGYSDLVFVFGASESSQANVYNIKTQKWLSDYDGVYINGYLYVYELAAAVAVVCQSLNVAFVNQELANPPSLSKLTGYAKLSAAGVRIPTTLAGSKSALLSLNNELLEKISFPAVLKRADADRGIDNFKAKNFEEVKQLLSEAEDKSIWVFQEYIENDGYYLVSFYDGVPEFAIYRTLETRPDGNEQKAHMFKPVGGRNASLIPIADLPKVVLDTSQAAIESMNRQIGSVDCIHDTSTGNAYILEVNYNPQLVTIETFKEIRQQAFIEGINKIGHTTL